MCCAVTQNQMEQQIVAKMQEMQSGIHSQLEALDQSWQSMAERHRLEMEAMERSKNDIIHQTAKEMDSLCRIIRDRFEGDVHGGAAAMSRPAIMSVLDKEV